MEGFKTALILPDCHINYEDIHAYSLAIEVGAFAGVDEIVLLGDYADFYCVSSHPKQLGRNIPNILEREVFCVNHYLDDLDRTFPDAKKVYIEGNHENRLSRYLQERCPELFGFVDAPTLFELTKRPNWLWIPYGPHQNYKVLNSKLHARHESIGTSAKLTATKAMCSLVFGHIHRKDLGEVVAIDGERYKAFCPGWLGNKHASSMQYVKNHHQWSLGFCIVHVNLNNRFFYAEIIDILEDYSCIFQGKVFRA